MVFVLSWLAGATHCIAANLRAVEQVLCFSSFARKAQSVRCVLSPTLRIRVRMNVTSVSCIKILTQWNEPRQAWYVLFVSLRGGKSKRARLGMIAGADVIYTNNLRESVINRSLCFGSLRLLRGVISERLIFLKKLRRHPS